MLQKDANLVKESLALEHFTSPVTDKQFQYNELERRQNALKVIERKFKESMLNNPNENGGTKVIVEKITTGKPVKAVS